MNAAALVQHLLANLDDEASEQRALLTLLERQEAAIASNRASELESVTLEIGRASEAAARRAAARERIVQSIARALAVPAASTTLASIAERIGGDAGRALRERRGVLRPLLGETARAGRRIQALARVHSGLFQELLDVMLAPRPVDEFDAACRGGRGGTIVDAEA